ncbi:hypothetical protein EDD36DRAFT_479580 [Exophiala viscosa]|uniref:Putative zinc-finger domain-containing protein n=1 Tax=Exophiala viscosa TaxID=2486360 RepID=A0AAN6E4G3_9EURO|nr:hypothetical protein EDD36DRAFT_479580 [Exophiala viscosa]
MAHPFSSNPFYAGTPSYAPQQPHYPFPPNGLQQQAIHTPPGLNQQPPQPPSYQSSPTASAPRYDTNPQIRSPFPPFPPPPATLGPDFFKQFANAGLPPPPPPSFPPVPLPNVAGFSQLSTPENTFVSSPYRPQTASAPAPLAGASAFIANEKLRQNFQEPAVVPQPERDTRSQYALHERPSHNYASYNVNQGGKTQPARGQPSKADTGKEEALPSFGSRSDLELLFATAQQQASQVNDYNMGNSYSFTRGNEAVEQPSQQAGSVSPYDPTRPATVGDRPSGGFGPAKDKSNEKPKTVPSKTFERTYDNKSPTELRQLAKGALLSLVPHRILYADLVKEGVDAQVLKELYGELGIKADVDPTQGVENVDAMLMVSGKPEASNLLAGAASGDVALGQPHPDGITPSQASLEMAKQPHAPSLNLERKDRIAQLLAAKAGRPTPTTPASGSSTQTEGALSGASAVRTVHTPTSAPQSPLHAERDVGQRLQSTTTAKAQPDVIKAKMEQLKRESEAKAQKQLSQTQMASGLVPDSAVAATPAKPIFGSASQIQGRLPTSAITSMIPGLFMTPSELASMDEADALEDSEMVDAPEKEQVQIESSLSTQAPASPALSVPQKRPMSFDPALASTEPQAKRTHVEIATEGLEVDSDEHSEGEIIEGAESDSAAGMESRPQGYETLAGSEAQISKPDALTTAQNNLVNEAGKEELYRAKQTEIEAMRRKIAELEQRNKLKRRSQIDSPASSNPPTPVMTRREQPLSSSPVPQPSASGIPAVPSKQSVARTIAKLTPAQLAERTAALKADLLRQRTQRQQVLQDGLPDLNFEVSKIEVRLVAARQELNEAETRVLECQSALEQAIKARDDLSEETAQLERQLQEGQSGQKQYADELQQIKLEGLAEAQASTSQGATGTVTIPETVSDTAGFVNNESHIPAEEPEEPRTTSAVFTGVEWPNGLDDSNPQVKMPGFEEGEIDLSQPPPGHQVPVPDVYEPSPEDEGEVEEDLLDGGLPRADTFQTDEMEISPEPEEAIEELEDVVSDPELEQSMDDTPMNVDDDSDGSASMSDSEDEQEQDYEPTETHMSHGQPGEESDEYDPEEAPVTHDATPNTGMDNDEEDFYEPSEHVEDLSAQPSPDVQQEPAEARGAVSTVPLGNPQDDIESGPQLTEADTLVKTQGAPNGDTSEDKPYLDGTSTSAPRFVPYKTPLSAFKTFRFHQDYNNTVKSGYRSLTYSNNIDPSRPLCPTELSGESCSDPTCEEQHFRQIGLPDDKILVQMSSAGDIKDKTTRDEFLVGLKHVIADLRSNDVKDFDSVAGALSNYRRKFFAEREETV